MAAGILFLLDPCSTNMLNCSWVAHGAQADAHTPYVYFLNMDIVLTIIVTQRWSSSPQMIVIGIHVSTRTTFSSTPSTPEEANTEHHL